MIIIETAKDIEITIVTSIEIGIANVRNAGIETIAETVTTGIN